MVNKGPTGEVARFFPPCAFFPSAPNDCFFAGSMHLGGHFSLFFSIVEDLSVPLASDDLQLIGMLLTRPSPGLDLPSQFPHAAIMRLYHEKKYTTHTQPTITTTMTMTKPQKTTTLFVWIHVTTDICLRLRLCLFLPPLPLTLPITCLVLFPHPLRSLLPSESAFLTQLSTVGPPGRRRSPGIFRVWSSVHRLLMDADRVANPSLSSFFLY